MNWRKPCLRTDFQRTFWKVFLLLACLAVLRYEVTSEFRKVLEHYRMVGRAGSQLLRVQKASVTIKAENLGLAEEARHEPMSGGSGPEE